MVEKLCLGDIAEKTQNNHVNWILLSPFKKNKDKSRIVGQLSDNKGILRISNLGPLKNPASKPQIIINEI